MNCKGLCVITLVVMVTVPVNTHHATSKQDTSFCIFLSSVGIRCADHATPLYLQKLALTSPTGGGRSVGIVRSRTKAMEFSLVLALKLFTIFHYSAWHSWHVITFYITLIRFFPWHIRTMQNHCKQTLYVQQNIILTCANKLHSVYHNTTVWLYHTPMHVNFRFMVPCISDDNSE
jgi:hypothetical protein